jgi:hypothetical protein
MNTSVKLNEFSKDQLQWMLNKATWEMSEITVYIENVEKYGLKNVLKDVIVEKKKLFEDLSVIAGQVIDALCDVTFTERVANN